MKSHIIEIDNLKKSYGRVEALKGIRFYVDEGAFFAFLGPSGAGKSTTIDILTTYLAPDEGEVRIAGYLLGKEDIEIRKNIGVVFQESLLDRRLTVEENLRCRGAFYGMRGSLLKRTVRSVMSAVGIEELSGRAYGTLSGGQRRLCDVARALLHMPKVLFLDEPTTGLDPQSRKMVNATIRKLQELTGMTVVWTTQYMDEAASADYVVIADEGNVLARGTPEQLRKEYAPDSLYMEPEDREAMETYLSHAGRKHSFVGERVRVLLNDTKEAIPLIDAMESNLRSFEVMAGTMEDVFIAATGKEPRHD